MGVGSSTGHRAEAAFIGTGERGGCDQERRGTVLAQAFHGSEASAVFACQKQLCVSHPIAASFHVAGLTSRHKILGGIEVDVAIDMIRDQRPGPETGTGHPSNGRLAPMAGMGAWSNRLMQDNSRLKRVSAFVGQRMRGIPYLSPRRGIGYFRGTMLSRNRMQPFVVSGGIGILADSTLSVTIPFQDKIVSAIRMALRAMEFSAVQHQPILTRTQE